EIAELGELAKRAADDERKGAWGAAVQHYRSGLRAQPEFAEFHFRAGECLMHLRQFDEARDHFQRALEHDGHPVRATAEYRQAIEETGAAFSIPVVRAEDALRPHSPTGILDRSLFHDNVHPTLRGFFWMGVAGVDVLSESRCLESRFGRPRLVDP